MNKRMGIIQMNKRMGIRIPQEVLSRNLKNIIHVEMQEVYAAIGLAINTPRRPIVREQLERRSAGPTHWTPSSGRFKPSSDLRSMLQW